MTFIKATTVELTTFVPVAPKAAPPDYGVHDVSVAFGSSFMNGTGPPGEEEENDEERTVRNRPAAEERGTDGDVDPGPDQCRNQG